MDYGDVLELKGCCAACQYGSPQRWVASVHYGVRLRVAYTNHDNLSGNVRSFGVLCELAGTTTVWLDRIALA